ncbi:MAG: InlB B-repeat-containing protein, partial [Clostridia bacterium]|nr:InlB B-repeat-containing protein [Clostridia bacterium]
MKKLFRNVSAIALSACMALSASAVALAGWNEDVYTPSVDTETTVYNWSDAYGEDGYILLGDGTGIIYSDLYQDVAYAKDKDFADVASTKGTSNKVLGGVFAGNTEYGSYRGQYYPFSQMDYLLEFVQAFAAECGYTGVVDLNTNKFAKGTYTTHYDGTSDPATTDINIPSYIWAKRAETELELNGEKFNVAALMAEMNENSMLATSPITRWGISGSTWSNVSGNTQWTTPAGETVNVRVQSAALAATAEKPYLYPYTLAFALTEDAVKDGGIYVTVRTYKMTGGEVMLKNAWYANNTNVAMDASSVEPMASVSVTGDGFVTFYIETAGNYTVVANDENSQEGITGVFFDKSEPTPAPMYDAVGFDDVTKANWESAYGNAGYIIYAGTSVTDRNVYTKNIYAGDSEGAYSKLDAWPTATDNPSREANYHPFKVNGADPDGTIISQFNDQTYLVRGDLTTASGLYVPGSLNINKFMTKSSSYACQSAVAFYVPQSALATAKAKTGNSVIYVTMYIPGESATRSAAATNTVNLIYSSSADITKLAPRALVGGSDTNSDGGLLQLNANQGGGLRSKDAVLAASQTYTFDEGDANGVYATFELRGAGYYAIQTLDSVERGTWSGIFFDYEKPVANESSASYVGAVKYGDDKFDANRVRRYGEDYYFIAATSNEANDSTRKSGSVDSNMFTAGAYGEDGLVAVTGSEWYKENHGTGGVSGLLTPNAGEYKTDIPVRNIYTNTGIRTITTPYGAELSDGTQSTALFKGNGTGVAGFTFEVFTNETVYVTAYFAQDQVTEVDHAFDFTAGLYKTDAFIPVAATNMAGSVGYKNAVLLASEEVTGVNGAYVTFAIKGKGIYMLAETFEQFSYTKEGMQTLTHVHLAPQALYVSTSLPEYSSIITTNLNGGSADIPTGFTADTDDIVLPTPEKTGYDFAGWKVNGADAVMSYTIDCSEAGDISLEATWTAKEFTVSFAGESVDFEDVSVTWDEAYDLSALVPTRAGYDFTGWYYNSYPIPTIGTYDQVPSDITLTAGWDLVEYAIDVDLAGGTADEIADSYTVEANAIVLPTPTRVGYTFAGWKVNGAAAVMEYTIVTGSTGDLDIVATWTAIDYAISVNLNGGEATIPATYTIEDVIVLPTPERTGYDFAGWKVNGADAVMSYTIENATGAIDLVATWAVKTYTINTNLNGGSASMPDSYTIESVSITLPTPVKLGATFAGWKVNGAVVGMSYTIASGSHGDLDIEATWTLNIYTISVNLNGGVATIPNSYTVDDVIVLPTPVKAGYTFTGWKVNNAGAVAEYTISGSTGNITLEATWTINTYTITTTLNGGTATVVDTYTVESAAIVLPTPVKANYTFVGWKVNGANAVANYTIATGTTGDITLEAIWTATEYAINVVLGDGSLDASVVIPATYT